MSERPELDKIAAGAAEIVFATSPMPTEMGRFREGLLAYLYAEENAETLIVTQFGNPEPVRQHTRYPSVLEIQHYLDEVREVSSDE